MGDVTTWSRATSFRRSKVRVALARGEGSLYVWWEGNLREGSKELFYTKSKTIGTIPVSFSFSYKSRVYSVTVLEQASQTSASSASLRRACQGVLRVRLVVTTTS